MLVEMVAALALTGLLLAMVLPSAPSGTGTARFGALVAEATALLRDARSQAIAQDVPVAARFDASVRRLRGPARDVIVPPDVDVAVTAGGNCPSDGRSVARIVFRGDGTNCGGVLRFSHAGRVVRLRVDWIDGRIDVFEGG